MPEGILAGKSVLVTGVRNKWSIAWHCATGMAAQGADLLFSVYSDREKDDVRKLLAGEGIPERPIYLCDATNQEQVDALATAIAADCGGELHGLIHAMAFAKREDLAGEFITVTDDGFRIAMEASVYSLVTLSRGVRPLMAAAGGGSIVTLTYLGGERVLPNYNIAGVTKAALEATVRYLAHDLGPENTRVNAVSAGPIKTLAAGGISGFGEILKHVEARAPLRRNVTAREVGNTVAFLVSPLASGITGEVLFVDAGYHIMGM